MTMTTKTLSESVATEARNVEIISYHTTMRLIARLAGYLVSNSVVLCKESDGTSSWSDQDARECRWAPRVPSGFIDDSVTDPHKQFYGFKDVSDNEKLSYQIDPEKLPFNDVISETDSIYYKLTFDLIPYREHEDLLKLVREASFPKCRSGLTPFDVLEEGVCDDPEDTDYSCKKKSNLDERWDDTVCHYDKDNMFVLIEVAYYKSENDELVDKVYAGLKRPSAHTVLALNSTISAACQWACSANATTLGYKSCRGKWEYDPSYDSDSLPVIKIINKGPGAIYKLLLKKEIAEADGGTDEDIFSLQTPPRKVLMPGESLTFTHPNGEKLCQLSALMGPGVMTSLSFKVADADNICSTTGYNIGVEHFVYTEPARLFYPLALLLERSINRSNIDVQRTNFTINPMDSFIGVMRPNIQMGENSRKVCFQSVGP